ncbi:MAG: AzlD domain-containing protein [Clostridia bacterium]|nr:AzlD domain-containing protein [Clostridia bacterium]
MKTEAILIIIMAGVTALLRFLPFLFFSGKRETPKYIVYLGEVLPQAIIGMLIVYCLRLTDFTTKPFGLPEIIAVVFVVVLQAVKRNSLLSVLGGTAVYMLLLQLVFK